MTQEKNTSEQINEDISVKVYNESVKRGEQNKIDAADSGKDEDVSRVWEKDDERINAENKILDSESQKNASEAKLRNDRKADGTFEDNSKQEATVPDDYYEKQNKNKDDKEDINNRAST